jgi:alkylated DNA repair dioxygenase AlkB
MNSLLGDIDCERLPLVDAELLFWPQVDLDQDYDQLLATLIGDSSWRQEEITVYGKAYRQPRLSAWHGDLGYSYSGIRLEPEPWTRTLLDIRQQVQRLAGQDFNSVLLNYYRDHNDRMGMHSDDEGELGHQPVIASLSLGETRTLLLRHKTRKDLKTIKLSLPSGSLLVMRGDTQQHWRHGINSERSPCGARVNLTFRTVTPLSRRASVG